jgi:hypothetical protein
MGRIYSAYEGDMKCISILIGDFEGKKAFQIARRRWEDNIKLHVKEMVCESVEEFMWTRIRVQRRGAVNTVMSVRVS